MEPDKTPASIPAKTITPANVATAGASVGALAAIAAIFGPEVTAAAGGAIGIAELAKAKAPKIPSTLVLIVAGIAAGVGLANFDAARAIVMGTAVVGSAWLGYAGIVSRFRE